MKHPIHHYRGLLLGLSLTGMLVASCTRDEMTVPNASEESTPSEARSSNNSSLGSAAYFTVQGARPDIVRLKLSEQRATEMRGRDFRHTPVDPEDQIASFLDRIHAKSIRPVFNVGGKYEKRQREAGLHLWYDVEFDDSKTSLAFACEESASLDGILLVEQIPTYSQQDVASGLGRFNDFGLSTSQETPDYSLLDEVEDRPGTAFDDPGLKKQWHYHNDGSQLKSVAGADINLFEAWQKETGRNDVIVAVMDGGIADTHEDLKESMWVNEAELNGEPDVDDDNNGFVDDIHGYNFYNNEGSFEYNGHGTHVAGTIAARNNNGIGVCGIAGGDGTPESGVRLMGCQIFPAGSGGAKGAEMAFMYAADNGAVIAQNSWGSAPGIPLAPSIKAAIDYFIKYAGCDENGNQLPDSPMKGGVVIFAAGNDGIEGDAYPGAYNAVIGVSSMSPNWEAAYYTERGKWIDIMAPGGSKWFPDGSVYSTVIKSEGTYGYKQGTSMACPHVSGVAALVVSHFGKQGFTAEQCKQQILTGLRPMDINRINPTLKGKLGVGYIDAARALDENQEVKPGSLKEVTVDPSYTYMTLSWLASEDGDDQRPSFYDVYVSDSPINISDLTTMEPIVISGLEAFPGDSVGCSVPGLEINTPYHFAVVARDRWGLTSDPVVVDGATLNNLAPELDVQEYEPIRLTGNETSVVEIKVTEPEGQRWTYKMAKNIRGVSVEQEGDLLKVTLTARNDFGNHEVEIEVSDALDFTTTAKIPFEVYKNSAPEPTQEIKKLFVPRGKSISLNLPDYFTDPDGHKINFASRSLNNSIATVNESEDKNSISISGGSNGHSSVEIVATDTQLARYRVIVPIQVVEDEPVYQVYPIPATTELNVRLANDITEAEIEVRATETGSLVLRKTVTVSSPTDYLVTLDLSKAPGGTYSLFVKGNDGKEYARSFIKY